MTKKLSLLLLSFVAVLQLSAQSKPAPPVSAEILFGAERTSFQLNMNRPIGGNFRYLNITSTTAHYETKDGRPELNMINSLIYQLHPYIGASAGVHYNYNNGVMPGIALHFSNSTPEFRWLFFPFLHMHPSVSSENVALVEYKPLLSENVRLFTMAKGLINYNFDTGNHARSYYQFRLGVTLKSVTFGAASNLDFYGSDFMNKNTFGAFAMVYI